MVIYMSSNGRELIVIHGVVIRAATLRVAVIYMSSSGP